MILKFSALQNTWRSPYVFFSICAFQLSGAPLTIQRPADLPATLYAASALSLPMP